MGTGGEWHGIRRSSFLQPNFVKAAKIEQKNAMNVTYDDKGCPRDKEGRVHGLSVVLHVESKRLIVVALASDSVSWLKILIAKEAKESGIELAANDIHLTLNGKGLDDVKQLHEEKLHLDANGEFDGANDRLKLEATFSVQLKSFTGNDKTIDGVSLAMTVDELKLKYNNETGLPVAQFCLIGDKKWPDDATLAEFSVAAGDVIFVMNRTEDAAATWGKEPPPQKKRACSVM